MYRNKSATLKVTFLVGGIWGENSTPFKTEHSLLEGQKEKLRNTT